MSIHEFKTGNLYCNCEISQIFCVQVTLDLANQIFPSRILTVFVSTAIRRNFFLNRSAQTTAFSNLALPGVHRLQVSVRTIFIYRCSNYIATDLPSNFIVLIYSTFNYYLQWTIYIYILYVCFNSTYFAWDFRQHCWHYRQRVGLHYSQLPVVQPVKPCWLCERH